MKYITAVILLVFLFSSCKPTGINEAEKRNEHWCWFVDAQTGEGKWVPVADETNLPDGDYTLFFCNGGIRQTGKIKDKKDCDTIFYYDLKGKVISKVIMSADSSLKEFMPDGKYTSHYATCEISGEGEFRNNKQVGWRKVYYKNGNLKLKSIVYGDSVLQMNYFESGTKKDSFLTVNKQYEGEIKVWYENGNLEKHMWYWNGVEDSISYRYYENGNMKGKAMLKNGLQNGYAVTYYENSNIKAETIFNNDLPEGLCIFYFENGQIEKKGNYVNGELDGECWIYHPNGKLKQFAIAKAGRAVSYKNYDETGKLTEEFNGSKVINHN